MEHNIGSTCLSIALANYLCNKKKASTAYVELNSTKEIQCMFGRSNSLTFSKVGIDIYPSMTLSSLSKLFNKHYDCLVIDFGVLNLYTFTEFMRCTDRLAIATDAPWKKSQLDAFLLEFKNNNINVKEDIKLLGNLSTKKVKPFHQTIPYFENPFQLTSDSFGFFEEILERK